MRSRLLVATIILSAVQTILISACVSTVGDAGKEKRTHSNVASETTNQAKAPKQTVADAQVHSPATTSESSTTDNGRENRPESLLTPWHSRIRLKPSVSGDPMPNSKFLNLRLGMLLREVLATAGPPNAFETPRQLFDAPLLGIISFWEDATVLRYVNHGRLIFVDGVLFRIEHDIDEEGDRRTGAPSNPGKPAGTPGRFVDTPSRP